MLPTESSTDYTHAKRERDANRSSSIAERDTAASMDSVLQMYAGYGVAPRELPTCADVDNEIQDLIHEKMDAERTTAGQTLDEFLAGES